MKPVTRESLDWEMKLVWDASFKDGYEEGKMEVSKNVAIALKRENYPIADIIKITGLSKEEIDAL